MAAHCAVASRPPASITVRYRSERGQWRCGMATGSDYDSEVQMFVQRPREIDLAHLRFLRWLAARGSLEHEPAGQPRGVYALADVVLTQGDSVRGGVAPAHPKYSE